MVNYFIDYFNQRTNEPTNQRTNGFTLIEILVAMMMLVIVIVSTIAIFRASATSWQKGELRAQRYQQARFILERLSREIASIFPVASSGPYCLGSDEEFYFVCCLSDAPASLLEVGYRLDKSAQELMRSYQFSPDYDFGSFDQEEVLSENISALKFSYSAQGAWQEGWDSRQGAAQEGLLPKAVKIEFAIHDEKGAQEESFSTVVIIASAAD
jgi:Tfp pilus assembly protein PilV